MKQDYVSKTIESPVGRMTLVAGQKGLTAIIWDRDDPKRAQSQHIMQDDLDPVLLKANR